MFKILKRIYDSKTFAFTFMFSVIGLCLYSLSRAPDIYEILKGMLSTAKGILLFLLVMVVMIWIIYLFTICFVKTAIKIKYRNKNFKFILVYSRGEDVWDAIITSEIKSLMPESCLVIHPRTDSFPEKWVPFAYRISTPGLFIISTSKKFDLWKSVRKAAYGYPTKLINLIVKINHEINR